MIEVVTNAIFGKFNPEFIFLISVFGFIIFLLYYYDSKKWNSFTDFDKIAFSLLIGILSYYLVVSPIVLSWATIHNFFFFIGEREVANPTLDLSKHKSGFVAVCTILFGVRFFHCGKALHECEHFHRMIPLATLYVVGILFSIAILLGITLNLSGYSDYYTYIALYLILSIALLLVFLMLYTTIYSSRQKKLDDFFESNKKSKLTEKQFLIGLAISMILISTIAGLTPLFKPMVTENHQEIQSIDISYLPLAGHNGEIGIEKTISKDYTVKTSFLVPWTKVETGIPLKSAYSFAPDGKRLDYIVNEDYFIFNGSSDATNVSATTVENTFLSDELQFSVKYPNYTSDSEDIELILKNNISGSIEIQYIVLEKNEEYSLLESDFLKIKIFPSKMGGFENYNDSGSTIQLINAHLPKNTNETITLVLRKKN